VNLDGFERFRLDCLKRPLLIIRARNGFLACAYIDAATCDITEEACAIVTGVSSFDQMLDAKVVRVSKGAVAHGVRVGVTGAEALDRLK
jgi:uncharacterized protein YunC (DUF1805 family)